MSRKAGRPRKEYKKGERPVVVSISVPENLVDAIPKELNFSRLVRQYLEYRFMGKSQEEITLQRIREQIEEYQNKIATLQAQEEFIIEKMKREDEERMKIKMEQEALAWYIRWNAKNLHDSNAFYDIDSLILQYKEKLRVKIENKSGFQDVIRNPEDYDDLPADTFLAKIGVSLMAGYNRAPWWGNIIEDYRKFREQHMEGD